MRKAAELDPKNSRYQLALKTAHTAPISHRACHRHRVENARNDTIFQSGSNLSAECERARVSGAVVFNVVVDRYGFVTATSLEKGSGMLSESANEAVQQWASVPFLVGGNGTSVATQATVAFQMRRK